MASDDRRRDAEPTNGTFPKPMLSEMPGWEVHGLSIIVCVAIANGYYIQPLIGEIGSDFGLSVRLWGMLPALTQFGLAMGLITLLPLADTVQPRRMLSIVLPIQAIALLTIPSIPTPFVLFVSCFAIGIFGITPYLLPPYASTRVKPARLAHVTAVLTRAVIVGILLARAVSGLIAGSFGWKAVYWVAGAQTALLTGIALWIVRPTTPGPRQGYGSLLASVVRLARTERTLQTAAFIQATSFGSFNAFWVGATLYLSQHFGWSVTAIGLVGLVAAVSASTAPIFAKAASRYGLGTVRSLSMGALLAAWAIFVLFRNSIPVMGGALVVLDVSSVIVDVSNRTMLYQLAQDTRARLNAVYTISMFVGGAIFSLASSLAYAEAGWLASCAVGTFAAALGLAVSLRSQTSDVVPCAT